MTPKPLLIAALLTLGLAPLSAARAQYDELINPDEDAEVGSPEWASLTLHVGMYQPDVGGDAFTTVFGDDHGPYIGAELHGFLYRIPYVGPIGLGASVGWARYSGTACDASTAPPDCTAELGEEARFNLIPLALLASLRIDVLARELRVPLVFTPKIGLDLPFFKSTVGNVTDGSGVGVGLRWAIEMALELDFLERRAARALDEEYGINHTSLFFQLFGSTAKKDGLKLGDPLAWTAGLGFVF